uniref:Uncharacterized protein n=1 Tax=Timema douglasi TaxID=61478 RepID=A0A7R8Z884_TIMDO|nr:unnamed protein product [Timema douglasi]
MKLLHHDRRLLLQQQRRMKTSQYASCPQLEEEQKDPPTLEEQGIHQLTIKYDSYQGLLRRRVSSVGESDVTTSDETSASGGTEEDSDGQDRLQVTERERLQVETFFKGLKTQVSAKSPGGDLLQGAQYSGECQVSRWRPSSRGSIFSLQVETFFKGLKTQVFVCGSLANLYLGSTSSDGQWELSHTGIPVVILDTGETRSRRRRRIQLLLAERGTCFTLWQDTIDNLSSYRVAGEAFHTLHMSVDHSRLAGLSFDCPGSAADLWTHLERLTADPHNISLSVPGRRKPKRGPKPASLPNKSQISQPCCFQHITSVEARDKDRYISLRSLVSVVRESTVDKQASPL